MKSATLPVSRFSLIVWFAELLVQVVGRMAVVGDDEPDRVRPDDELAEPELGLLRRDRNQVDPALRVV